MEIVLIMSQEHETLPKAEIKAVLKAEGVPFKIKSQYGGVLILDIPEEDEEANEVDEPAADCRICLDPAKELNAAFISCGHQACFDCAVRTHEQSQTCPVM